MNIKDIGLIVRSKRLSLGLRMEDVARETGLSRMTLSMIENGCCNYSFTNLMKVFDCLGLTLSIANGDSSQRERAPKILTKSEKKINRFIVMCIEDYAKEKSLSGQKIYQMMEKKNLFKDLREDYEDLHGMSESYLNNYLERVLMDEQTPSSKRKERRLEHLSSRIIIISHVIEMIAERYRIPLSEARRLLYLSNTINLIEDDETGLYGEDPSFSFQIFVSEYEKTPLEY